MTARGQNADLRSLIGDKFNITGDPSGTVRLPDLRSRVPIGSRDSADQDLDNGLKLRTFGATGGSHKLQGHDHGNPRISNHKKSLRPANSRIRMGSSRRR